MLSHPKKDAVDGYRADIIKVNPERARTRQIVIDLVVGVADRDAVEEFQFAGNRLDLVRDGRRLRLRGFSGRVVLSVSGRHSERARECQCDDVWFHGVLYLVSIDVVLSNLQEWTASAQGKSREN